MHDATIANRSDLEAELRRLGFGGCETFLSARTLEAQGAEPDFWPWPESALPCLDARRAVSGLRRILDSGDGLPVVQDLLEAPPPIAQDGEVAALVERIRRAGFGQALLFAFAAKERDVFCIVYAMRPVVAAALRDAAFALAHHHVQSWLAAHPRLPTSGGAAYSTRFSAREREILGWCACGKSNWEIARILEISDNTVRFHLKNAYRKLDATSRSAAINAALARGVIRPKPRGRKAALIEMYRRFIEGDARPFRAMLADDVVLIATAPPELFAQGGRYVGPDAVLRHAATVGKEFACRRFLPLVLIEDGDNIAVYLDVELVHRRSGNVMAFDCAHFLTFRDDKIVHYVELFNTAAAHCQRSGATASSAWHGAPKAASEANVSAR